MFCRHFPLEVQKLLKSKIEQIEENIQQASGMFMRRIVNDAFRNQLCVRILTYFHLRNTSQNSIYKIVAMQRKRSGSTYQQIMTFMISHKLPTKMADKDMGKVWKWLHLYIRNIYCQIAKICKNICPKIQLHPKLHEIYTAWNHE